MPTGWVDFAGERVIINVTGRASTSGCSDVRLAPHFYIRPPADGIWEFDLVGDPPQGIVLQVLTNVSAWGMYGAPDWLKGVRVYGATNDALDSTLKREKAQAAPTTTEAKFLALQNRILVSHELAVYDDSHQPIGFCRGFSVKMKKLRHTLTLTVEGPDENRIRSCIQQATAAGLVAAIVAAYATGGTGLSAAIGMFLAELGRCLGSSFSLRVDDSSHWIEWCT